MGVITFPLTNDLSKENITVINSQFSLLLDELHKVEVSEDMVFLACGSKGFNIYR